MSHTPESFKPLEPRFIQIIEDRLEKGVHGLMRLTEKYNDVHQAYVYQLRKTTGTFRNATRKLGDTFYEPQDRPEQAKQQHPMGRAVERVLIVGSAIADRAWDNVRRDRFLHSVGKSLTKMADLKPHNPYELDDIMVRCGSPTRAILAERFGPKIFYYGDGRDSPTCNLYANAIGYMAAETITRLTLEYMEQSQPKDNQAAREIDSMASYFGDPMTELTLDDL